MILILQWNLLKVKLLSKSNRGFICDYEYLNMSQTFV